MHQASSDLVAPMPTPHWGSQGGAAFSITATTTIKARPQIILDTLLNTSLWPKWNNFVPRASLYSPSDSSSDHKKLKPGVLFTEHVDMAGRGRSTIVKMKLLMTSLDEMKDPERLGFKVVWLGKGYPDWALRSERVHQIYTTGTDEQTHYDVHETFSGPLAWFVNILLGKILVKRFGQWNEELKNFVERGHEGADAPSDSK